VDAPIEGPGRHGELSHKLSVRGEYLHAIRNAIGGINETIVGDPQFKVRRKVPGRLHASGVFEVLRHRDVLERLPICAPGAVRSAPRRFFPHMILLYLLWSGPSLTAFVIKIGQL
jgi:hypothetical protein